MIENSERGRKREREGEGEGETVLTNKRSRMKEEKTILKFEKNLCCAVQLNRCTTLVKNIKSVNSMNNSQFGRGNIKHNNKYFN